MYEFNPDEKYWSAQEVADRYNLSVHTVWKMVRTGVLPALKAVGVGKGRNMRIPESALAAFEQKQMEGAE